MRFAPLAGESAVNPSGPATSLPANEFDSNRPAQMGCYAGAGCEAKIPDIYLHKEVRLRIQTELEEGAFVRGSVL